jgi:hypothetical protein
VNPIQLSIRSAGLLDFEMMRIPYILNRQFTDGADVSLTCQSANLNPRNIPDNHFGYRLCRPQGHSMARIIRKVNP